MAQVVATRTIQSSFACPSSGSVQDRVERLKPSSFSAAKVLFNDKKSKRLNNVVYSSKGSHSSQITAKRSVQTEVVPVSPEDVPKVCTLLYSTVWLLRKLERKVFSL